MALIDDLISYWKFDVNNIIQIDSHGSNNLSVVNASYTSVGKINSAYLYNGVNRYMTGNQLSFGSEMSVQAWIDYVTLPNGDNPIITQWGDTFYFSIQPTGIPRIYLNGNNGVGNSAIPSTYAHVIFTYDGANLRIYINGSLDATRPMVLTIGTTGNLKIGSRDSLTQFWNGGIDEIGIWDRKLTDAEVSELYNSGDGLQYPFTTVDPELRELGPYNIPLSTANKAEIKSIHIAGTKAVTLNIVDNIVLNSQIFMHEID